ncbi:MAG: hypothetical protein RIR51_28 [Bacteroidota bacterium]|jgi:glycogen(starch) synthase
MATTKAKSKKSTKKNHLIEIAWETCNQVGGIYTVLRTKVPSMVEEWGEKYNLIGPYFESTALNEFEEINELGEDPIEKSILEMREMGHKVHYGYWIITGKPKIILFEIDNMLKDVNSLKGRIWRDHKISTLGAEELVDQTIAFGELTLIFMELLSKNSTRKLNVIAHFHEWMAATCLPDIKLKKLKIATVFTTHATMLGRYIAGNVENFYDKIEEYDWLEEAKRYNIEPQATFERKAAILSDVMTTVSEITAQECKVFLGRNPDVQLPNGLNIQRFAAMHEHQILHTRYKKHIDKFVMGHFFQNQPFDLENTLYFFTSGRYEFTNKGYNLCIDALAELNKKMKKHGSKKTVVMFFITKRPYHNIDPEVLHSSAVLDEIRETCDSINKEIAEKLFIHSTSSSDPKLPNINEFIDDYWKLRLKRTIQSWKRKELPKIVTHFLKEEDDIIKNLVRTGLINYGDDRVKVVYHPDFIVSTNPLFGLDYGQFVRGCNLGIFPSYYEPWGYTPLECIARGVPTVTSNLSGFGAYMMSIMKDYEEWGVNVIDRENQSYQNAVNEMVDKLFKFVQQNQKERTMQRNRVESIADTFDWSNLRSQYDTAHELALMKKGIQ